MNPTGSGHLIPPFYNPQQQHGLPAAAHHMYLPHHSAAAAAAAHAAVSVGYPSGSGYLEQMGLPAQQMFAGAGPLQLPLQTESVPLEDPEQVSEGRMAQFWEKQSIEQATLTCSAVDFKTHSDLPLARIKRIMKADEDVRMVSAEAPVVFARACRMFILELTHRSWFQAETAKRKTLQKEDTHSAILKTDIFDFLVDVVDGTIEEEQRQMKLAQQKKQMAKAADAAASAAVGAPTAAD